MAAKNHKFIGEDNRMHLSVMAKRMIRREHSHFDIFKRYRPGELQDNTNFATIK
jgi:hypothetical protein